MERLEIGVGIGHGDRLGGALRTTKKNDSIY
jgi:hypothetical protein